MKQLILVVCIPPSNYGEIYNLVVSQPPMLLVPPARPHLLQILIENNFRTPTDHS